jgi:hypothetical protein
LTNGEIIVTTDATIGKSGGSNVGMAMADSGSERTKAITTETMKTAAKEKGVDDSGGTTKMIIRTIRTLQKILLPAADLERRVNITRRILEKCDKLNAKQ